MATDFEIRTNKERATITPTSEDGENFVLRFDPPLEVTRFELSDVLESIERLGYTVSMI